MALSRLLLLATLTASSSSGPGGPRETLRDFDRIFKSWGILGLTHPYTLSLLGSPVKRP